MWQLILVKCSSRNNATGKLLILFLVTFFVLMFYQILRSATQSKLKSRYIKHFTYQNNSWQLLSTKLFSRCLKWNRFIRLCLRIYLIQKVRYILWHKIVLRKPASSNTASTSSNKQHQTVSSKDVLILLTFFDDTIVVVPIYFSSYDY